MYPGTMCQNMCCECSTFPTRTRRAQGRGCVAIRPVTRLQRRRRPAPWKAPLAARLLPPHGQSGAATGAADLGSRREAGDGDVSPCSEPRLSSVAALVGVETTASGPPSLGPIPPPPPPSPRIRRAGPIGRCWLWAFVYVWIWGKCVQQVGQGLHVGVRPGPRGQCGWHP